MTAPRIMQWPILKPENLFQFMKKCNVIKHQAFFLFCSNEFLKWTSKEDWKNDFNRIIWNARSCHHLIKPNNKLLSIELTLCASTLLWQPWFFLFIKRVKHVSLQGVSLVYCIEQLMYFNLPCQLLGSNAILKGHGPHNHSRPDHGGDRNAQSDPAGPGNNVEQGWSSEDQGCWRCCDPNAANEVHWKRLVWQINRGTHPTNILYVSDWYAWS